MIKRKHGVQLTECDIKNIKRLLEAVKVMPIDTVLNERAYEYFEYEMMILEKAYNEAISKK